ncbi:MAG: hypothetical protein JNM56_00020 [Planctomycetia bacterium]|nr:hypothetical protein [Planctomycetia bacterium]
MPAIVDCPSCHRKLRVPDDLLGRNVKGPTCSTTFQANAAAEPTVSTPAPTTPAPTTPAPPPPPPPLPAPPGPSLGSSSHQRCAYCGEDMPGDAERCPHCGEMQGEDRPWEQQQYRGVRRDCEPHRGGLVLTFGIISVCLGPLGMVPPCCYINILFSGIGLGLGIAAIIMGKNDLAKMRQGVMDPQGQGTTQAGWICGIVGTVLNALAMIAWIAGVIFFAIVVANGP